MTCFNTNDCATTNLPNLFTSQQRIIVRDADAIPNILSVLNTYTGFEEDIASFSQSFNDACVVLNSGSIGGRWCHHSDSLISASANDFFSFPVGSFDYGGVTGAIRLYGSGFSGPATAPTGACPRNGVWLPSDDGKMSFCKSGTWEVAVTAP
jgi:hypothetical protein